MMTAWRRLARAASGVLLLAAAGGTLADAPAGLAAAEPPSTLGLGTTPHIGALVPDIIAQDDQGRHVQLRGLLHGRPGVLVPGWYRCANLCGVTRDDLFAALARTGLRTPEEYGVISLSIDPAETPADAARARADDLARHPSPGAAAGWHFLVADAPSIEAVSAVIGLHARWDAPSRQWLHPAGVVILDGRGRVTAYLQGVGYAPADLRSALVRSAAGQPSPVFAPILLLCLHWDSLTGRWSLDVLRALRLAAGLTVAAMAGGLWLVLRRERAAGRGQTLPGA